MGSVDLTVVKEEILYDDNTLVNLYKNSISNFESHKKIFYKKLKSYDTNDYLSYTMARLAYGFAKEEYDSLMYEAKKRGLIV